MIHRTYTNLYIFFILIIISFFVINCNSNKDVNNLLTNYIIDYMDFISDKKLIVIVEEVDYEDKIVFRLNSFERINFLKTSPIRVYETKKNIILSYSDELLNFKKSKSDLKELLHATYEYPLLENNGEWYLVLCKAQKNKYLAIKDNWYKELSDIDEINNFNCN